MNRLILIGNGFDLAHGLKTKYEDFIFYFLKKAIASLFDKRVFEIPNLVTYHTKYKLGRDKDIFLKQFETAKSCIDYINKSELSKSYHHDFVRNLLLNYGNKWVDIEEFYFESLKTELKNPRRNSYDNNSLNKLNFAFEEIKNQFAEYLSQVVESYSLELDKEIGKSIFSPFNLQEFKSNINTTSNMKRIGSSFVFYPKSIYFLNFNYTSTINQYIEERNKFFDTNSVGEFNIALNNIHGQFSNPLDMIFGYGDEIDETYKEMENSKSKEFLEHIKSFKYLKHSNYRNLMNFLDGMDYQVYVMGHSCGLSDRVMLKRIFENKNCKSIKIFYHDQGDNGIKDFTLKTYDIALHFDDNTTMREKVVSKDLLSPLGGRTTNL